MAGAGKAAPAGNWIVDRIQARGADIVLRIIAIIGTRVGGKPADQVIKAGKQLIGEAVRRQRAFVRQCAVGPWWRRRVLDP